MSNEKIFKPISGWVMLTLVVLLFLALITSFAGIIYTAAHGNGSSLPSGYGWWITGTALLLLLTLFLSIGFFIVEPNGCKVLLLFGKYVGSVKESGFWWANPLLTKRSISLRARTLTGERLKVNDLAGNPVEIAAVIVWQVNNTYNASFEVDNYEQYVTMQSETAIRHLASVYPYDAEEPEISLRRNVVEVSEVLTSELRERLERAGVRVLEARLSHLAYAPEIAGAMLRRQQATAIIAARQKIVDGAVGMVEMALEKLEESKRLQLDDERKAAMVTNLLVVLCSEQSAQPVLNTGTLYS